MINAFIKCQKLTINQPLVVAETIDYLELKCHFFTSDWDGLTKWMHFRQGETTYDIQLTDDEINKKDHLNLSAGEWDVYVHGNENVNGKVVERITTNTAKLTVEECGNLNGEILPIKPLEVAEQLQAEIDELKKKAVVSGGAKGQALIKKSNADYDMEWGDVAGGSNVMVVTVDKNNTASLSVDEIRKKVLDGAIVELEIQATPTEKVRLSLFQIGERAIFTTTEIMDVQDTSYQVLSISAEIVGTDVYVTNFFKTIDTSKQTVDSALSTTSTNPVQNKIITEEFSRPQYNTLRVNITANPISPDQFKADYSAEEIRKWDVAGGDIEATFTDVITNTGEQRYPFARYVRNEGKAYFFRSVITPDKASRIVITIDNNKNVEFKEDVLNNATKDDIQALEDSKANYTYKVIATDKVSQNDAREVLTYIDQYDGKLIEFLTNGENPSKAVATGRIFTDVSGNAYLVTYNIDGTITVWNKESYEKHNFETKSLINEPIVDLDNLTIDTQGEAPYMASVQKAFNKPQGSSDFGIVTVIAYDVTKQIQIYRDIISGKVEYRTITGTADRHSFSTWQSSGGGTVDTEMSSTSENAVQNKVIKEYVDNSINPQWEVIYNETLTEKKNLVINTDLGGATFKLKKFRILLEIPAVSEYKNESLALQVRTTKVNSVFAMLNQLKADYSTTTYSSFSGELDGVWTTNYCNSHFKNAIIERHTTALGFWDGMDNDNSPIKELRLVLKAGFPIGTKVKIYGVKDEVGFYADGNEVAY